MNKKVLAGLIGMCALGAFAIVPRIPRQCQEIVCVWVFDIGQGDAIYIDGKDVDVVIDGGPTDMVIEKVGAITLPWDRSIEGVVLTHPDADHLNGLAHLLGRYRIQNVYDSLQVGTSAEFRAYVERAGETRVGVRAGDNIDLGAGAYLEVVYPEETFNNRNLSDPNGASIIMLLHVGDNTMLLTGDAGVKQEQEIIQGLPQIDVLKVGHHGSRTSTSAALLEQIEARIAVIPVGKDNDYGHPHTEVLENLLNAGITVYQTDIHGDVRISFGDEVRIKLFSL